MARRQKPAASTHTTVPLSDDPPCLTAAIEYLRRGWPCFPLCPGDHTLAPAGHKCTEKRHGKAALVKWAPYQERLPTEQQLREWWEDFPSANVGMALGDKVSGLIGVDIDGPEGRHLLLEILGGEPPPTLGFLTPGGGCRYFYRLPAGVSARTGHKKTLGRALTVIGQGGSTVMPPSVHRTGGVYSWPKGLGPDEMEIAPAPQALLDSLRPQWGGKQRNSNGVTPCPPLPLVSGADWMKRASSYCDACPPAVEGDDGDLKTFNLACGLARSLGLTEEQILYSLETFYNPRCDPPWPTHLLKHKAEEAYKRHGGGPAVSRPMPNARPVPPVEKPGTRSRPASSYRTKHVEWFLRPWVPMGMLTLVVGLPGTGKSSFSAHLLSQSKSAIILPGWEESFEIMTVPRLIANGVNLDRVHVLDRGDWRLPHARDRLVEEVEAVKADLVLFDPISSYLAEGGSENDGQFVRPVLEACVDVATQTNAAVVGVRHPGKNGTNLMVGSREWRALPRSIVELMYDPGPPATRLIRLYKDSLGQEPAPRRYDLIGEPGKPRRFIITGECTKEQAALVGEAPDRHKRSQVERAKEMLELVLKDGEVEAKDVFSIGEKERLKEWAVYLAASLLDVQRRREGQGMAQRCYWHLPTANEAPPVQG